MGWRIDDIKGLGPIKMMDENTTGGSLGVDLHVGDRLLVYGSATEVKTFIFINKQSIMCSIQENKP